MECLSSRQYLTYPAFSPSHVVCHIFCATLVVIVFTLLVATFIAVAIAICFEVMPRSRCLRLLVCVFSVARLTLGFVALLVVCCDCFSGCLLLLYFILDFVVFEFYCCFCCCFCIPTAKFLPH